MLRASVSLSQHGDDVAQGLGGLQDEVVGLKLLLGVPADLATDKYLRATRGNAVRVAFGGQPAGGVQVLHVTVSFMFVL